MIEYDKNLSSKSTNSTMLIDVWKKKPDNSIVVTRSLKFTMQEILLRLGRCFGGSGHELDGVGDNL